MAVKALREKRRSPLYRCRSSRRRSSAVGRKLRLLRAHGLIAKVPHTHRYQVSESGRAILTALVAIQEASIEKLTQALAA